MAEAGSADTIDDALPAAAGRPAALADAATSSMCDRPGAGPLLKTGALECLPRATSGPVRAKGKAGSKPPICCVVGDSEAEDGAREEEELEVDAAATVCGRAGNCAASSDAAASGGGGLMTSSSKSTSSRLTRSPMRDLETGSGANAATPSWVVQARFARNISQVSSTCISSSQPSLLPL